MNIEGKLIFPGNVEGKVLKYNGNFSFLGGVDPKSGILSDDNRYIGGKIFVFDSSSGSTVGSYIIYALKYYGHSPLAILCKKADETLIVGSIIAEIPSLSEIDVDIIADGDTLKIENSNVEINIEPVEVVTSILYHNGKILILKRSDNVSTYKGKWAGVSGYKEDLSPEDAAKREIIEETGIKNPLLKKKGGYMYLRDGSRLWKIYTFLWEVNSEEINIDWEHTEYKWIYPEKIKNFDTVPGLNGAIKKLLN